MTALTAEEVRALHDALDSVQKAWATWSQVLRDLGDVRPFSNIVDTDARHLEALARLFARFDVPVAPNPWDGRVPRFSSRADACRAGIATEEANADLYERLLDSTRRADLLTVFRNLQSASQERHLPAFRRSAGDGGPRRKNRCG